MRYTSLITYVGLLLFLTCNSVSGQPPVKKMIDALVAQVGDNIVLLSDIENQKLQMAQNGMVVPPNAGCVILEELMFQNLLVNQAEIDSLVITDEQINAEMESRLRVVEEKFGGDRIKMETFYGKSFDQLKTEFFDDIKRRMLAQEMQRKITEDLEISPKEIKAYFDKIPVDSLPYINSRLGFQHIVCAPQITDIDKLRTKDELKDIRAKIISGKASFESMARIHSADKGSAKDGGRIEGSRGQMVPQFEATAFSLKVGEISEIFETDYGYHFMKLLERKGDDYICQHILMSPEFSMTELDNASKKIEECHVRLLSKEITWDQAVLEYSTDKETKYNKGTIMNPINGQDDWSTDELGQVDPQIFALTDVLKPGEFTTPTFYTDFMSRKEGIRIVRLSERSEPHVANLKDDYPMIQRAAENEKRENTINDWVKSKIQNAYVRIDPSFLNCEFRFPWSGNTN